LPEKPDEKGDCGDKLSPVEILSQVEKPSQRLG
jgi:hypothetical protein